MKLDDVHSYAASVLNGTRGLFARTRASQPELPLELYEFESCPFCRKAREAFSELDLDYISRPTPRGSERNRQKVAALGGTQMFPYLVDPNTGAAMYESEDIIGYLHQTYGDGRRRGGGLGGAVRSLSSMLASAVRPIGGKAAPGVAGRAQPEQLLVLWQFEASPFCRKVREALCSLDLDYRVRNVAKSGGQRPELVSLGGKMQVPYLVDPNTGVAMYESSDIVAYLRQTHGGGGSGGTR